MFESARIKLTIWYLFFIMVISIMFSIIIYEMLAHEVEQLVTMQRVRIEKNLQKNGFTYQDTRSSRIIPPVPLNQELIDEVKLRIMWQLAKADAVIFILAAVSGYLLAGKTLQPIKKMVQNQTRFISDTSHELRTPLTSLRTAFEVHLRGIKKQKSESDILIEESLAEVIHLQKLADSMLQLTQYEHTASQIKLEKINSRELITPIIKKMKKLAQVKKIKIEEHITPASLRVIKESMAEAITILIDNAIKYSSTGGIITVTGKLIDNSYLISVTDTGIGISEKDLPNIFDRFYRADEARTYSEKNGYGLGLSIARKIMNLHQGTISVVSELKKGSTFTLKLPL